MTKAKKSETPKRDEIAAKDAAREPALERAAEPILENAGAAGEKLVADIARLESGASILEVLKDHVSAVGSALARGDVRGGTLILNRGLATLDAYTAEVALLRQAAEHFVEAVLEVRESHTRIIAVLQERASVTPTDTWSDAYTRIAALEAEIAALKTSPFQLEEVS